MTYATQKLRHNKLITQVKVTSQLIVGAVILSKKGINLQSITDLQLPQNELPSPIQQLHDTRSCKDK